MSVFLAGRDSSSPEDFQAHAHIHAAASCTYDSASQLCQTKRIKTVLLALIKPIHHTPTPDSGHAGQSTSKQASAVDMPDTHHTVPVHLKASSSQLNGLMQLGTSESRPSHRAMDAVPRCVTALCIDLAESIIPSYSACHGCFMPSFMP